MAVVAIPVLLHLLMRRKPVPHRFPALRFLQARSQVKKASAETAAFAPLVGTSLGPLHAGSSTRSTGSSWYRLDC